MIAVNRPIPTSAIWYQRWTDAAFLADPEELDLSPVVQVLGGHLEGFRLLENHGDRDAELGSRRVTAERVDRVLELSETQIHLRHRGLFCPEDAAEHDVRDGELAHQQTAMHADRIELLAVRKLGRGYRNKVGLPANICDGRHRGAGRVHLLVGPAQRLAHEHVEQVCSHNQGDKQQTTDLLSTSQVRTTACSCGHSTVIWSMLQTHRSLSLPLSDDGGNTKRTGPPEATSMASPSTCVASITPGSRSTAAAKVTS